jgi:hypothetical protein
MRIIRRLRAFVSATTVSPSAPSIGSGVPPARLLQTPHAEPPSSDDTGCILGFGWAPLTAATGTAAPAFPPRNPSREERHMGLLWIILIVVLVLVVLGGFGARGRW